MEESAERGKAAGGSGNGNGGNGAAGGTNSHAKRENDNQHRLEVYEEVLKRLKEADILEAKRPGFELELWNHFHSLPARYAMDFSVERAEDIVKHMELLEDAKYPAKRPSFWVKIVHVPPDADDDTLSDTNLSAHPSPSFESFRKNLVHQTSMSQNLDEEQDANSMHLIRILHEITFASDDKPKFLNEITSLLGDLGLNIQEAHAFSTNTHFSLDVFIVTGWHLEETAQLTQAIEEIIEKVKKQQFEAKISTLTTEDAPVHCKSEEGVKNAHSPVPDHIKIPSDGTDEWEIDMKCLKFGKLVASGTYGNLYRGSYYSQEVAIKVLKHDRLDDEMLREFRQEVYILRKVRHKKVVQFIGASTKLPNLCIVTEFMSGGSLYDHLHKHKAVLKLPSLIRIAIDIAKGMDYLHQHNIIHRDLKTANILIDEKETIKIADFGVARVKNASGVMTAETGTYRWMAPEVIEHTKYDQKADVFSFGIVLWELLTAKIPHEYLTPLQAAIGVVQQELRPPIPKGTHPELKELMVHCWQQKPDKRPDFGTIVKRLQEIAKEVGVTADEHHKLGLLSFLHNKLKT